MKNLATYVTLLGLLWTQTLLASRISLTASDGTGLELHQLEARVVLDGFLALTELSMVFYNPENRRREGRFQLILPNNAAISRFAMQIGTRLQEGEVLETQRARRVYEEFLHRRQDPALLEMDSGNRFNARIFPIEAKSEKRLILSYSQRLDGAENEYVLPLKGLPLLKQLSLKVFYKAEILTIEKHDYQPLEDFRMSYQAGTGFAMQSGQLVAAKIIPFSESDATRQEFEQLIIFIDTSASQAPYLSESLERLQMLLPQLKVGSLLVYTFDQAVKKWGQADNPSTQAALIEPVKQHHALGASRFDAIITTLKALKIDPSRLLLISDAVITAGETSATQLTAQLKTIDWLERVDILIPSYYSDKKVAAQLAKAGKSPGIVAPLNHSKIIHKLTSPVYTDVPITVSGSTWHWPEKVETFHKPPANESVDVPSSALADLEEFVASVKKEAKSKALIIGPFPVGCIFPFYYEANGRRDPFMPFDSDEEREANTSAPLAEHSFASPEWLPPPRITPWSGHYAEFRALLDQADFKAAGKLAQQWRQEDKVSVMALIALGEWYEKTGNTRQAARAYGSLIDYFPARADIRRWAAERLLAIKSANWLSIDSLKKAAKQRPDHPSGHYLLAIAYWEGKQYQAAVETLQAALRREFPRFATAKRLLTETLALMLTHLQQQLKILFPGKTFNWEKMSQRQLRLALMWETDTNNVNLHIYDNKLHHADGTLYANITTGYGPEYFQISEPQAFPYKIEVHYANRGPMGYGMGVLHILNYAPKMGLRSEFRPFVVMKKGAFVELGEINK